jgi:hypothetical protein
MTEKYEFDSGVQAREAEYQSQRKAAMEEYFKKMAPILDRLRKLGCEGECVEDMMERQKVISPEITAVLLAGLPELAESPIYQFDLICALMRAAERFDGRALVETLNSTNSVLVQGGICQVIARKEPHSIDNWLSSVENDHWGNELKNLRFTKFPKKRSAAGKK